MQQIYQRFDLDLEAMTNLGQERLKELRLPQAGTTLCHELMQKGYEVLESNESFSGVPQSVIVGGNIRSSLKPDFYELAAGLGLIYGSGPFYTQRSQTE